MGNLLCTPKQEINQAVQSKLDIRDKFYKGRVAERVFKLLYNAMSINFFGRCSDIFIYNFHYKFHDYIASLKAELSNLKS